VLLLYMQYTSPYIYILYIYSRKTTARGCGAEREGVVELKSLLFINGKVAHPDDKRLLDSQADLCSSRHLIRFKSKLKSARQTENQPSMQKQVQRKRIHRKGQRDVDVQQGMRPAGKP
jgi:hypothetical protein